MKAHFAKVAATLVGIFLILLPTGATTAAGVIMLVYLWAPGALKALK